MYAALRAVHHRDRGSPVPLPGDQPIAEPVVHVGRPDLLLNQGPDHRALPLLARHPIVGARVHEVAFPFVRALPVETAAGLGPDDLHDR